MARIRSIKPDIWQDEEFSAVSLRARLLFIGLITQADDEGRLKGDSRLVRAWIFPMDDLPLEDVDGGLKELIDVDLVVEYFVDGKKYLEIPGWLDHQRISSPTPSRLPRPDGVVPEVSQRTYKKKSIPEKSRRALAKRYGAVPGEVTEVVCEYCEAPGSIHWARLASGKPGSWVQFSNLEIDHIVPEVSGGSAEPDNLQLLCAPCNRKKGHGKVTEKSRKPVTERNGKVTETDTVTERSLDRKGEDKDRKGEDRRGKEKTISPTAKKILDRLNSIERPPNSPSPTAESIQQCLDDYPDRDVEAVTADYVAWQQEQPVSKRQTNLALGLRNQLKFARKKDVHPAAKSSNGLAGLRASFDAFEKARRS